jgi:hypothetical protein
VTVSVIDVFEMIDVDQRNRPTLVLALATLKLDFQLILPGAVVEQTGQAVGSAQGQ